MMPNIIFNENGAFGNTNYEVVRLLLYMVDVNMMSAIERPFFSTRRCIVVPTEDAPMCSKVGEEHIIFLNVKENYWCQWVYQFAHEYCHHLIDGTLTGEWSNLLWFEETICELSSLYNLNKMVDFCSTNGLPGYSSSVQVYLGNLLTKNNAYNLNASGGWYLEKSEILKNEKYKRDLYNAIAVMMYPLFVKNPTLWKLILNIGDIRSWTTLDDLFSHLEATADCSYSESLCRLRQMFS